MEVNLKRIVSGTTYTAYAIYTGFSIGDSSTNYVLSGSYDSGTGLLVIFRNYIAGNALGGHVGR